jgi:protein involved in polysaccharide export with SLBB domain
MIYGYHTSDNINTVETGGYFNNADDDLNLDSGDLIHVVIWDGTPFDAAQIPNGYSLQVVTTVDPAGVVNTAEAGVSTAAAISSGN